MNGIQEVGGSIPPGSTIKKFKKCLGMEAAHKGGFFVGNFSNNFNGYGVGQKRGLGAARSDTRPSGPKPARKPLSFSVPEVVGPIRPHAVLTPTSHEISMSCTHPDLRAISIPPRTASGAREPGVEGATSETVFLSLWLGTSAHPTTLPICPTSFSKINMLREY